MGRDVGSGVDSLSRHRGGRARPSDAAHVRADAARCDPRLRLDHGPALGRARRRLGPDLPLRRLGCRVRDRGRPPLPPGDELGRGARRMVGGVRDLEGRPRRLGRDRTGRDRRVRDRPSRRRRQRCSPTASPRGSWSRRASVVSATGGTRSSSASRPTCRGASRSIPRTVRCATSTSRPSIRPSSTRHSGTSPPLAH